MWIGKLDYFFFFVSGVNKHDISLRRDIWERYERVLRFFIAQFPSRCNARKRRMYVHACGQTEI
jgi:hypothetical protein